MSGVIRRLDATTVNRIAAGEVVQRPAAAVKELLENSIDAGATSITVTIKQGGLEMIQIQDNGCGIRKEDLAIVCERFTTSKLTTFEDLRSISTFGFRGEALASITHVAHVTITTKTAQQPCAYKAKYLDGQLAPIKPGDALDPKPCAGMTGTTITVEDLFYNMQTRKLAFKNASEHYQKVLDVVTKYAIHYGDKMIAFTCRKHGQSVPDLHTPSSASSSIDNIKIVYGVALSRELLRLNVSFTFDESEDQSRNTVELNKVKKPNLCIISGYASNANYSTKRSTIIIFINNRLVECSSIKKLIENLYTDILPKNTFPFVYISITMQPHIVDVNVHPTKKEVCFLFEGQLLQHLYSCMTALLASANASRAFVTQTITHIPNLQPEINVANANIKENEIEHNELESLIASPFDELDSPMVNSQASVVFGGASLESSRIESIEHIPSELVESIPSTVQSQSSPKVSDSINNNSLKRSSSSQSTAPNKMIRTDPSLTKINNYFPSIQSKSVDPKLIDSNSNRIQRSVNQPQDIGPDNLFCSDFTSALCRINMCSCCNKPAYEEITSISNEASNLNDTNTRNPLAINTPAKITVNMRTLKETSCQYESILELLSDIDKQRDESIEKIIQNMSFVGVVDAVFFLGQVGTKLFMFDHSELSRQLFYQLAIRRFGELPSIHLSKSVPVCEFVSEALDLAENKWSPDDGNKEDIALAVTNLLFEKRHLLSKYFSLYVDYEDETVVIREMPALMPGYLPCVAYMPTFILRLATCVDWDIEIRCFDGIAHELALYYSRFEIMIDPDTASVATAPALSEQSIDILSSIILPAYKNYLIPNRKFVSSGGVIEVTSLEKLYKVFERC